MIKKRSVKSIALLLGLMMALTGCGNQADEVYEENIELLEPVNTVSNVEIASKRDLYQTTILSAAVFPTTTEYSFTVGTNVSGYGAFPGEEVKKGQLLAYNSAESLKERIEKKEESIEDARLSYLESIEDYNKNRKEIVKDVDNYKHASDAYERIREPEYIVGSDGVAVINPEYAGWLAQFEKWNGKYRISKLQLDTLDLQYEQMVKNYELDSAYSQTQLKRMQDELAQMEVRATQDGRVASIGSLDYNYWASEGKAVISVANDELLIRSDFISKSAAKSAKMIYAFINGNRYEVEYEPMDADEYKKISEERDKVYTTFHFVEQPTDVNPGDFAVIAVVTEYREKAVSVSKEAVHKDEAGNFVYVFRDGETIYTPVRKGFSDGLYTEILSGLEEGDQVLITDVKAPKETTTVLTKGSFYNKFDKYGYMYYPSTTNVVNEVDYGTTYFTEFAVELYNHVEKGDLIATVYVVKDELTLQRKVTELTRAEERLADYKELNKNKTEAVLEEIARREEKIAELREEIEEIQTDFATTKILANATGIIVSLANYEEQSIVGKGATVASIADESNCYVVVENENQQLNYGNKVTITYQNQQDQAVTVEGEVALLTDAGVSRDLEADYSVILLPKDAISDMSKSTQGRGWWFRYNFHVEAPIREMKNVVIVPKKAVTDINGCTYVDVVEEDGSVVSRSFVAGGYDTFNYWVVEGLTEGMEICLE